MAEDPGEAGPSFLWRAPMNAKSRKRFCSSPARLLSSPPAPRWRPKTSGLGRSTTGIRPPADRRRRRVPPGRPFRHRPTPSCSSTARTSRPWTDAEGPAAPLEGRERLHGGRAQDGRHPHRRGLRRLPAPRRVDGPVPGQGRRARTAATAASSSWTSTRSRSSTATATRPTPTA
ncbi:MAG: hypothetical protein MZV64_13030 [Ignavibacteriales bacterium]|nr:hypothetical protein [Ignavibacteriales bacterium]